MREPGIDETVTSDPVLQLRARSRWMAFALDPATATEDVRREVDRTIDREPALAAHRGLLTDLLARRSAGAREDEAALGALRYEEHPTYGSSIASMTGWLVERNPARRVEEEVADNLARLIVQSRLDHLTPSVRRVRFPFGDGVRVETARRAPADAAGVPDGPAAFQAVEYHIPLDRPPASLLFLRFLTANVAHLDHLLDEFDAIVRDLELPTGPGGASVPGDPV